MKTYKIRMNGKIWEMDCCLSPLNPLKKPDAMFKKLVKYETTILNTPRLLESKNGTIFKEVEVGKPGWAHRGWDYYELIIPEKSIKVKTRSCVLALKIFMKFC